MELPENASAMSITSSARVRLLRNSVFTLDQARDAGCGLRELGHRAIEEAAPLAALMICNTSEQSCPYVEDPLESFKWPQDPVCSAKSFLGLLLINDSLSRPDHVVP